VGDDLSLKEPPKSCLGMRLPPQRHGGNEVRLEDVKLYLPPFSSFIPSLRLKRELCLYGK